MNYWPVVGWVICGILAYGLCKNRLRRLHLNNSHTSYEWPGEALCIATGLYGIIGLLIAIIVNIQDDHKFGLCYLMPKELCEPRRS